MRSQKEVIRKRTNWQEEEKKPKTEHSGRVILFLLLVSSGLALFFYLSSFLPGWWQKVMTPRTIRSENQSDSITPATTDLVTVAPSSTPWGESLEGKLRELISQESSGRYGLFLFWLDNQQSLSINGQEVFSAASLMKLPVIVAVYQGAEKRNFDLGEEYSLKNSDKVNGNGSVYLQPEGTVYTYRSLAKLAIEQSDNTASGILARAVGEDKIGAVISNLGLQETDYNLHQTSPEDIGRLLIGLYRGDWLTSAHSQEIIGYLSQTIFNDQIPAALPEGLTVAHKVGLDSQIAHDAAIIFSDYGDFVLVIMSEGEDLDRAQEVSRGLARMVWQSISV